MQPAVACVSSLANTVVRHAPGVDDVRRFAIEERWFPDLVVALQSWPDQFSAGDVRNLLSFAPLARIVCVCGAWCDSEGRTHLNWPLAVRSPVSCAAGRISRELAAIRGETIPLPLTAGRGEIFAADCAFPRDRSPDGASVAVVSPERRWLRMVAIALSDSGHPVVDLEDATDPLVIVWDADPWESDRSGELHSLRSRFPQATIVACLGFVRDDLTDELRAAGADSVWFKLAPLATLRSLVTNPAAANG